MNVDVYCEVCKRWYHLVDTVAKIDKQMRKGCNNCGSRLITVDTFERPDKGLVVPKASGIYVPPPVHGLEPLRDNQRLQIDHSQRILEMALGKSDDTEEGRVGSDRK